jgi:endonuclease-3
MQSTLDFGATRDLGEARDRLLGFFGPLEPPPRRRPIEQLVKSLISNRTYDHVSLRAYERLTVEADWGELASTPEAELKARIFDVEFADRKATHLKATLGILTQVKPDFDLEFLGGEPMTAAFAWLERLPGVGRKVAASVLNFSTLQRPALVIDSHLKRVLSRLGFVDIRADAVRMYDATMQAANGWTARELTDLHVWLKRLGQQHCRPRHSDCPGCPLRRSCSGPGKPAPLDARFGPVG